MKIKLDISIIIQLLRKVELDYPNIHFSANAGEHMYQCFASWSDYITGPIKYMLLDGKIIFLFQIRNEEYGLTAWRRVIGYDSKFVHEPIDPYSYENGVF